MGRLTRLLRLLTAVLAVRCLGCDAFEAIIGSLVESPTLASVEVPVPDAVSLHDDARTASASSVDATIGAADACDCALGHAAVTSVGVAVSLPAITPVDFADRPRAAVLPAPEPPLRPPVA